MAEALVVGPRQLPGSGLVRVWIEGGSGGGSYIKVRREQLAPAEMDSGEGEAAIYRPRALNRLPPPPVSR